MEKVMLVQNCKDYLQSKSKIKDKLNYLKK